MKRPVKFAAFLSLAILILLGGSRVGAQEPIAAGQPAQRLTLDGVENFGRIGQALYRGAQPKSFAFNELKNIGVSIVVDFRDEKDAIATEKRSVEGIGMQFVSLPWRASHGPDENEIAAFLQLVRDNPGKKIFVHCKHGADRTGLMVAVYRITFDHWNSAQAVSEMYSFHYHGTLLPNLKRYVSGYHAPATSEAAVNPARTSH
jgi:protein tyrosine/serine phosphatase